MNNPSEQKDLQGILNQVELFKKTWDQCTIEEKLEKLRLELQEQQHLSTRVNNLDISVSHLKAHTHSADGRPVIEISNLERFGGSACASRMNHLR